MGKSKPQDALAARIQECLPRAYVSQENYIIDLIEECGYTENEVRRELGHPPHRMFVDIVLRDSEQTVAFEYHGEQHYSLVGNMTKTDAELLLNQQLDQEKSWILSRIGIPLVAIPYDMYVDESVLFAKIDEAAAAVADDARDYTPCGECQRLFPANQLSYGVCKSCEERLAEEEEELSDTVENDETFPEKELEYYDEDDGDYDSESYKRTQKEKARKMRKAAREAYKNSPEYIKRKEEKKARDKAFRKELNRQRKEERRKKKEAERLARKERPEE